MHGICLKLINMHQKDVSDKVNVSLCLNLNKLHRHCSVLLINFGHALYLSAGVFRRLQERYFQILQSFLELLFGRTFPASYFFNPFHVTSLFLYLLKTSGFLMFSRGIERAQWHEMS